MKTERKKAEKFADSLRYSKEGLVPSVASDADSGEVLMLAYANREAVARTLGTGTAFFFSRSRRKLWKKGETSGNTMQVASVSADCDRDALLYKVRMQGKGMACHTGSRSCFGEGRFGIYALERLIEGRKKDARSGSYTARLLSDRRLAAAKVIEEAAEVAEAFIRKHGKKRVTEEAADVLYHLLALLASEGVSLQDVERELEERNRADRKKRN